MILHVPPEACFMRVSAAGAVSADRVLCGPPVIGRVRDSMLT